VPNKKNNAETNKEKKKKKSEGKPGGFLLTSQTKRRRKIRRVNKEGQKFGESKVMKGISREQRERHLKEVFWSFFVGFGGGALKMEKRNRKRFSPAQWPRQLPQHEGRNPRLSTDQR